jgi:predicted porin
MSAGKIQMNLKPIAFAAALLGASAVYAQSTVQLYGIVDAGVTRVSGLEGGSLTTVSSGIMEGSRWGLKGTEDIGGGYKAIFTLESRFEADTGTESSNPLSGTALPARIATAEGLGVPLNTLGSEAATRGGVAGVNATLAAGLGVNKTNKLFDRQAFVGLITPVGAIIAGRQYTPAFETLATFDAMKTESSLSGSQIASIPAGLDIRMDNALQYRIQLGGVTANLMYAAGESNPSSSNKLYGGMVSYKGNGFSVGVGHNKRNNELGEKSLTNTIVGATYEVGPGTVSFVTGSIKDDNPSGLSVVPAPLRPFYINAFKQDARLTNVGYRFSYGSNTVTLAYTTLNDKRASNADVASYGFAYSHSFSKRTDVNFVWTKVDNKERGQAVAGGNGYLGGVSRAPGVDSTSIQLGLRHRF